MMRKNMAIVALLVLSTAASAQAAAFTNNGNGTVSDSKSGLMWEQKTTNSKNSTYTWQQALAYCEDLVLAGHSDWFLPDIKELHSIVDYTEYGPSVTPTYFPNIVSDYYWSSSSVVGSTSSAWSVVFDSGFVNSSNKTGSNYARCVRP